MAILLRLSAWIDRLSEFIGRWVIWLVLAAAVVSAVNATVRKAFSWGSNAFLELQWYLFAAVFLLAAGYTLLRQGHVRIDVLLSRFSRRTQAKVELFGLVFFLGPFVYAVITGMWPLAVNAYVSHEMSENAGGLPRWYVYALIPAGFFLLGLQGISECIKRLGFLLGCSPDTALITHHGEAEKTLAEEIAKHQVAAEVVDSVEVVDKMAKAERANK